MKYTEKSHWTIKERPEEVRGKGALKGALGEVMKVPERTLRLGTTVRRRAQNLNPGTYADEEFTQQEATEQMIQNDAADVTQAGASAVSALGRKIRKEIQASQNKTSTGEHSATEDAETRQSTNREVNRSPPGSGTAKNTTGTGAADANPSVEVANDVSPGQVRSKPEATVLHERKPFSASHVRGDNFELRGGHIKTGSAINSTRIDYASTVPAPMQRSHFFAKQSVENAKVGAKKFWAALKNSSEAVIRAARSAALALQAAVGAGGSAVIAVVIILCLGAGILASPFGIFAHFETDKGETPLVHGAVPLTTAIEQINKEYTSKIEGMAKGKTDSLYIAVDGNDEGAYEPQNWADVLAVFAVKVALDPEHAMDVIELDKTRVALLRQIFWDMNEVEMRNESEAYSEQVTDPNTGQTSTVERTRSVLCIEGHSDAYTDMVEKYHLNKDQQAVLEQLTGSEFWPYWRNIVSRSLGEVAEDWSGTVVNPVGGMKIPVLYQYNYKQRVCIIDGQAKSVSTSGCGATSASMVIAYLTGNTRQTPYTLFKWAYDTGRYHGDGLDHGTISKMCSKATRQNFQFCRVGRPIRPTCEPSGFATSYGVTCSWVSNTEKNVLNALQNGCPVIAHMGPGIFTKGGHYIVLRGVTADGKILVNDPNSSQRTKMAFPLSTIIKQLRTSNCIGVCRNK